MNIICFGQQPCGFFPKRFLAAKINTAKKLQTEIGGRIVFFCHDSDADYRETITIMQDRRTGAEVRLNFIQPNKIQKKYSPLYKKMIAKGWKQEILKQLPRFLPPPSLTLPTRGRETADSPPLTGGIGGGGLVDIFKSANENLSVADFCLAMYKKMGLLEGIEVIRSSDKNFREKAMDLDKDYFADVEYQGEIVRAKIVEKTTPTMSSAPIHRHPYSPINGHATIGEFHEGGGKYIRFGINQPIQKSQKSAGRAERFAWMQNVIHCTHYILGESEKEYLDTKAFPEVKFIMREKIEQAEYAWTETLNPKS